MLFRLFGVVLGLIATTSKGSALPSAALDGSALHQNSPSPVDNSFEHIKSLMPLVTCDDFKGTWKGELGGHVEIFADKNGHIPEGTPLRWVSEDNGYYFKNTKPKLGSTSLNFLSDSCTKNSDGIRVSGVLEGSNSVRSTAVMTLFTPNVAYIKVEGGGCDSAGCNVGIIKKNPPQVPAFEDLIKDYKDLTTQNQDQLREVYDRSVAYELSADNIRLVVAREEQQIRSCKDEESIHQPVVCGK